MNKDSKMSFWEHADELRSRILIVLAYVSVFSVFSYIYVEDIIQILLQQSEPYFINFQVLKVTSMFMVVFGVSFFTGLIISFPILIYNVFKFLSPAFQITISRLLVIVIFCSILFSLGVLFGYYIVVPILLDFFTSFKFEKLTIDIQNNFTLDQYLRWNIRTMFMNGIIFQMPVVSFIGSKVGILTPAFLRHYRRHSFIFFLVMSALITPPDPLSQIVTCIPFIILYEVSIIIAVFTIRERPVK